MEDADAGGGGPPRYCRPSDRRPLRFLTAREEYERFRLQWLFRAMGCIPVDRARKPEKALRALDDGEIVTLFPHGGIHLGTDPPRRLKAGAARLAKLTGSPSSRCASPVSGGRGTSSVALRSRSKIELFPPIESGGWDTDELLEQMDRIINHAQAA